MNCVGECTNARGYEEDIQEVHISARLRRQEVKRDVRGWLPRLAARNQSIHMGGRPYQASSRIRLSAAECAPAVAASMAVLAHCATGTRRGQISIRAGVAEYALLTDDNWIHPETTYSST